MANPHDAPSGIDPAAAAPGVIAGGDRAPAAPDAPGGLVDSLRLAFVSEGLRMRVEGVGTAAQIDQILREVTGFPLGPFELPDPVSLEPLDAAGPVTASLERQLLADPRQRLALVAARRLAGGRLDRGANGRRRGDPETAQRRATGPRATGPRATEPHATGPQGTEPPQATEPHATGPRAIEPAPPTSTPVPVPDVPVWVDPAAGAGAHAVTAYLQALGARLDAGPTPDLGALLVLAPLGHDATLACTRAGVDPQRAVAIDTLLPITAGQTRRRVLMPTPATRAKWVETAQRLFGADGAAVSVIADSPGFVVQRVLAMCIAIAAELAAQGGGAPDEIDAAARLGLGFPLGPLEWGDRIGPALIDAVLAHLQETTGDPRYRPAPWLRRRALLGLALRAPAADGAG
jgi:3-hydroxybutyryl-CoA dehydrogenase